MGATNSSTTDDKIQLVNEASDEQPDATVFNAGSNVTLPEGLTPQQGQAAILLASGMAVQDVAEQLGVHRTTLWHWRNLETFEAFTNELFAEVKQNALNGLMSLQADAISTVEHIMKNGSDGSALRAACYVLEQVEEAQVGPTDPRDILRTAFTTEGFTGAIQEMNRSFNERGYQKRCEELGIEP